MGYMRHHAIVVTSFQEDLILETFLRAMEYQMRPSPPMASDINGYWHVFVPPDGSKEGWEDSNEGDSKRDALIEWLEKHRYEDGSSPFDWVEIQYGDDNKETQICRHSDEAQRLRSRA